MSADNFYVVDYVPGHVPPWAVTMGFMSDDDSVVPGDGSVWFETAADALMNAHEQFAEYGVEVTTIASRHMNSGRRAEFRAAASKCLEGVQAGYVSEEDFLDYLVGLLP